MREIDLIKFYQLGKELTSLSRLKDLDIKKAWYALINTQSWLWGFEIETSDLPIPKSRKAAEKLREETLKVYKRIATVNGVDNLLPVNEGETWFIKRDLEEFETEFEYESRHIAVFCVTPKGDRDVRILIEDAAKKFEPNLQAVMPKKTLDDIREAGRC